MRLEHQKNHRRIVDTCRRKITVLLIQRKSVPTLMIGYIVQIIRQTRQKKTNTTCDL